MNTFQMPVALLVSLFLVSCATSGDLAKKTPVAEFDSARTTKEFSACVSNDWSQKTAYISTLVLADGFQITLLHPTAGADATVLVRESGLGSHIRYSERIESLSPSWMKSAVINCK